MPQVAHLPYIKFFRKNINTNSMYYLVPFLVQNFGEDPNHHVLPEKTSGQILIQGTLSAMTGDAVRS